MELTEHQSGHGCLQMNTQHMVKVNSDIQWFHCKYIFPLALLLPEVCFAFLYNSFGGVWCVCLFLFEYLFGSLSIDI